MKHLLYKPYQHSTSYWPVVVASAPGTSLDRSYWRDATSHKLSIPIDIIMTVAAGGCGEEETKRENNMILDIINKG